MEIHFRFQPQLDGTIRIDCRMDPDSWGLTDGWSCMATVKPESAAEACEDEVSYQLRRQGLR